MSIIIAGGTGLIGTRLTELLIEKGYTAHILTRQDKANKKGIKYFKWQVGISIDMNVFEGATAIINLTGAGIADKRWSKSRKKELLDSRVEPAKFLQGIMKSEGVHLKSYSSASGSNYYPNDLKKQYDEKDPPGDEFIQDLCVKWENQANDMMHHVDRVSIFRTGVVLAKSNSFLQKFTFTTRFLVAGLFGSGTQPLSWIHIDDLCHLYIHAIENPDFIGEFNAGISDNESHLSFIRTYLEVTGKKAMILKAPKIISKLVFGEMSTLLNDGVSMSHQKAIDNGFQFQFEDLRTAIQDLTKKESD